MIDQSRANKPDTKPLAEVMGQASEPAEVKGVKNKRVVERLDHHTIRTLAEAHSLLIFQVKAHLENFHSQQIDSRLL